LLDTQVLWFANLPPEYILDENGDVILDEFGEPLVDESGGQEWVLDGSQLNELDTGGYLDGDVAVDLSEFVAPAGVSISRGRNDQFADVSTGSATIVFQDIDRRFDSTFWAGPYHGQLVPGKKVQIITNGVIRMEGTVRSWRHSYRANAPSIVTLTIEDALAKLGRRKFTQWTTTPQQPRARIMDVLMRNEVAYTGPVAIDEGVFTLQADNVSYGSSVLNYLQLIARSDRGRIFASRDNTLTFRDRLTSTGSTNAVLFSDDGSGVDIEALQRSDDARTLYTRVTVDREGGIAQTAVNAQAEIDYDGARSFDLSGLLLSSDTDSESLANYLVGTLSVPEQRIESITVKVPTVGFSTLDGGTASTTMFDDDSVDGGDASSTGPSTIDGGSAASIGLLDDLLALDLADVVQVRWTPLGIGGELDVVAVIESMNETITPFDHEITFGLSTVANRSPWTLEDELLGALDGVAVLSF
jgi:hypothetical protein